MFYTYILQSEKTGRYYTGSTQDVYARLKRHRGGWTKSLKNKGPFQIVHTEMFSTREEAYRREREIKKYKGGILFKKLLTKEYR